MKSNEYIGWAVLALLILSSAVMAFPIPWYLLVVVVGLIIMSWPKSPSENASDARRRRIRGAVVVNLGLSAFLASHASWALAILQVVVGVHLTHDMFGRVRVKSEANRDARPSGSGPVDPAAQRGTEMKAAGADT